MSIAKSAACFLACILLGLAPARAESVHQARGDALRLYSEGRYQEALPLFDQVLKHKPHDIDSLNKRGCIYLRMNQPLRALPDFNAAVRYVPFLDIDRQQLNHQFAPDVAMPMTALPYWSPQLYPSAFTNRGIALMMLGRDEEALADFEHAINLRRTYPGLLMYKPGMASSYSGIGQVLHRQGKDAQAIDAYDLAIGYNPNDPNALTGRGTVLAALGRPEEALSSFNSALQLDPRNARAYGHRALLFDRLGRDEDALGDYVMSIRLEPGAPMIRRYRGALLSRLGRQEEAVADLTEAIRLDPADAGAYKDRGGIYQRIGDNRRSLLDLDEAIRLDPRSSKAFQNRAAAHNGLAQYDQAIRDCDEALRLDPLNAGARSNRGLALTGLGQYEEAIAELSEAIRLEPRLVAAYFNRGGAYRHLGMLRPAEADYEEVLRLQPKLVMAAAGLGEVRALLQIPTRSAPLGVSVESDPASARQQRTRGDALWGRGDWSGALGAYDKAVESDPDDLETLALRGWARLISGRPGPALDARRWLDRRGWRDPLAPYMALLGVLAARRDVQSDAAETFLSEGLANTRPPDWPAPLFRFLKHTLPTTALIAAADTPDHQSEAHVVIGLDLLYRGERTAAVEHLRRAAELGSDRSIARALARATLRRSQ